MKRVLLSLSILLFSGSAFAALAPFYHTANEVKAILEHPDVVKKLGAGRPIDSIVRSSSVYTVSAGNCALEIQVTYVSLPMPGSAGPAQLELHLGKVNCASVR